MPTSIRHRVVSVPCAAAKRATRRMMGESEQDGSPADDHWASFDLEQMYCGIGRVVVLFQVLENQV